MPQGNTYPIPQLPLTGNEQITLFQTQGGAPTTTTATISELGKVAPVQSVSGRVGSIILSSADITNFSTAAAAASPVQSVAGKTGAVTDLSAGTILATGATTAR